MSAVAVPMLALGPLQGRDSSASGRLRIARRPSGPHGGPLRAFQVHGGTPGHPLKHPSTPVPGTSGSVSAAVLRMDQKPLRNGAQWTWR